VLPLYIVLMLFLPLILLVDEVAGDVTLRCRWRFMPPPGNTTCII